MSANLSYPYVVCLTGGIASGKSTVAKMFHSLGIETLSADDVARDLMSPDSVLVNSINEVLMKEFNLPSFLLEDQSINRPLLRQFIFDNPKARRKLDELTHPAIGTEIEKRAIQCVSPYLLIEIPLLIEANMQELANRILVVESSEEEQLKRIVQRDQSTLENAKKILDAQLSNEQRRQYADDLIINDGTVTQLENKIKLLHHTYLNLAKENQDIEVKQKAGLILE